MLSPFRIITMLTRVFARPLIETIKQRHKATGDISQSRLANFFTLIGNIQYRYDLFINRKLLFVTTDKEMFAKPLNKMVAVEKGVELFYESMIYGVVIVICIYELKRLGSFQAIEEEKEREKKRRLKQRIKNIEHQQHEVLENIKTLKDEIEKRNAIIDNRLLVLSEEIDKIKN